MGAPPSASLEYSRRLYDNVFAWYQSADTKAQVVLALDAAFVAFLASGPLSRAEELKKLMSSNWTRLFLVAMTASFLVSIAASIWCLRSRMLPRDELDDLIKGATLQSGLYTPPLMWFFQMLAALDGRAFLSTLQNVDAAFEEEALASQIQELSKNVVAKHQATNLGFVSAALTFVLFLFAGISLVLHVS